MANAIMPALRKRERLPRAFLAIIDDCLSQARFQDAAILDIGPGHWDFLDIARSRGARRTMGIDFDPAVCRLGEMRGHDVAQADLRKGWPLGGDRFDGIFCRASINIYWFDEASLADFLGAMAAAAGPEGWIWIVPWNNPPSSMTPGTMARLDAVADAWRDAHGIRRTVPSQKEMKRFGIGYDIPDLSIWHRL